MDKEISAIKLAYELGIINSMLSNLSCKIFEMRDKVSDEIKKQIDEAEHDILCIVEHLDYEDLIFRCTED